MLFGVRSDGKAFLFQAQRLVGDFEQLQNVEASLRIMFRLGNDGVAKDCGCDSDEDENCSGDDKGGFFHGLGLSFC